MIAFDWKTFLIEFNNKLWNSQALARHIRLNPALYTADVLESKWLGYPGATEYQLKQAEARLKTKLPESFREFLTISNGWRCTGYFIPQIWSTGQLEWFAVRRSDWIGGLSFEDDIFISDEEYFVYGPTQKETSLRWKYLSTNLEISDHEISGTASYMLNPLIVTPEGEWEAWFYAHWLPGAKRFRSFKDLLLHEFTMIE